MLFCGWHVVHRLPQPACVLRQEEWGNPFTLQRHALLPDRWGLVRRLAYDLFPVAPQERAGPSICIQSSFAVTHIEF